MTEAKTAAPLVVVVAFQSDALLPDALAPLASTYDIVVVDNGSAESTRSIALGHGASYLDADENRGFAAGVNLAIRESWDGVRDVLLLNPDALLETDGVRVLHEALLADPGLAAVGPRLVSTDGAAQRADWPIPSPGQVWFDALALTLLWRGPRFVVGAALLIRGEALRQVGEFDERYFLYAEEADWQLRAHRQGWRVALVPSVTAKHIGGASSSDPAARDRFFYSSGDEFARRWYGRAGATVMRLGMLVAASRRSLIGSGASRDANRRALPLHARHFVLGLTSRKRQSCRTSRRHVVQIVRSDGFAGVERYIADVSGALARRGWRVTVLGGDPARMRSELPHNVEFRPARTTLEAWRQLGTVGPVDVVHAHMTAAEICAVTRKRRVGARIVVSRHFAAPRGRSLLGALARPLIRRRVDAQVAISHFVADRVDGLSVVIHNGVRPSSNTAARREDVVVVMQRLEAEKDTATAVHAWALGELAATGWQLHIYGRGTELVALRSLAASLGVQESVFFRGFTDDPRAVLRRAGIFLATAPAEPFGLSVVEAMAEGAPIVAAEGGAHSETLGGDAEFFNPHDVNGCARELYALISDRERRHAISAKLRERFVGNFLLDTHVDRLVEVYQ